jgi:S1-C subfamily serine protease
MDGSDHHMNDTPDRPTEPMPLEPGPNSPASDPVSPEPGAAVPEPAIAEPAVPASASGYEDASTQPTPPTDRYSPAPEPRTDWSRPEFAPDRPVWPSQAERPMPTWQEPVPAQPVTPPSATRRGGVVGPILAASLISAVLASGGTYLTLNATGALDQPTAAPASPAIDQTGGTQPVTIDESSATIDVAAKVGPAVVKITTEAAASADPLSPIPDTGVGSGVIYDANGWILTNRHVVAGSDKLTVELQDGHQLDGTIYGIDTLTDLAIVKVDATGLPTAALGNSDALKVGQLTVAIGSPLGTYSNSVTSGILSAKGRQIDVQGGRLSNLLQTDTAINPGNSGGPLLDASGAVIGINTAIASSAEGIGFAIPINLAKPIMAQAVAGETLARPYIGVRFVTIDMQVVQQENLKVEDGALVKDSQAGDGSTLPAIVPDGPADRAGLTSGDIITKVDDVTLDGEHPLDAVISQFTPGDVVTLTILRDGSTRTVDLTLGTRPADL